VAVLLDHGLVNAEIVRRRLADDPQRDLPAIEQALAWLAARS
jgi:hypothetical protein